MQKVLITGARGFLGSNLVFLLSKNERYSIFLTSRSEPSGNHYSEKYYCGDLLDKTFVNRMIAKIEPDIVINTVSLVNVDLCEENPALAEKIIVNTSRNLANSLSNLDCRLIHISTDQLFNGEREFYSEDDIPSPLNVYGRLKLDAENIVQEAKPEVAIIRTNFFGWSPPRHPPTFAEWIFNGLNEKKPMTLFTDLFFSPLEVSLLIESLQDVMKSDFSGIVNIVGSERCSKFDFGIALASTFDLDDSIIIPSKISPEFFKAARPRDMSLSINKFRKIFNRDLPDLRTSLARFFLNRPMKTLLWE